MLYSRRRYICFRGLLPSEEGTKKILISKVKPSMDSDLYQSEPDSEALQDKPRDQRETICPHSEGLVAELRCGSAPAPA